MKHFKIYSFVVLLAGLLLLASCVKEKSFPPQPSIEFLSYQAYSNDSADCNISFKDGDGDIGNMEGDTTVNMKFKYLYLDTLDHTFKPYDYIDTNTGFDTLFYTYIIKDITPTGQYKALQGQIRAKLRAAPLYFPTHKVVKFEIRMRDRSGNWSNTVTTNEIHVN